MDEDVDVVEQGAEEDIVDLEKSSEEAPVVRLVNPIL